MAEDGQFHRNLAQTAITVAKMRPCRECDGCEKQKRPERALVILSKESGSGGAFFGDPPHSVGH
ncbi:hypothetical protein, partial [Paracoccus sp. SSK6]|uniref:hypothetical protein n=1 Tax=Paracoccus sp. SSK6 TaxID=3143131 RepID=UPI00321930CB